ncbi:MAG: chemotaxis protein CheW [bacterium]
MNSEPMLEVVIFNLAAGRYAVESVYVREVYPLGELTPLPCTPAFVTGIMNVRGDILAVIDLRVFLDLPGDAGISLDHVIIVESDDSAFGILTDAATETAAFPLRDLEVGRPAQAGIRGFFVLRGAHDRLIVLDLPGVASDKRLLVHEYVPDRESEVKAEDRPKDEKRKP